MSSSTTKTIPKGMKSPKRRPRVRAKARTLLSPSAFGAELGVTRTAVAAAIRAGRLSDSVTYEVRGQRRYAQIDLEMGRSEWAKSTGARKDNGETTVRPEDLDAGPPPRSPRGSEAPPRGEINFAEERARKEMHLADRYEMENAVRRGELMDKGEVLRQMFELGRVVRDGLHTLPAVLAPDLVGLSAKEIAIVLEGEVSRVASKMADKADQIAAAVKDGAAA